MNAKKIIESAVYEIKVGKNTTQVKVNGTLTFLCENVKTGKQMTVSDAGRFTKAVKTKAATAEKKIRVREDGTMSGLNAAHKVLTEEGRAMKCEGDLRNGSRTGLLQPHRSHADSDHLRRHSTRHQEAERIVPLLQSRTRTLRRTLNHHHGADASPPFQLNIQLKQSMNNSHELYRDFFLTLEQFGGKKLSDEQCCQLLAWLLIYGGGCEATTANYKPFTVPFSNHSPVY